MSLRTSFCLLALPLLTGCQYLPHTNYFTAPANEPNPAWVRIVNYTQHAAIYQYEDGVRSGGVVRTGPLPFINTQDVGMPKAGRYYQFKLNKGPRDSCTSDASLIERGKDGISWHLTPNPDVTYKHNGPTAKKRFNNARFEDPNFHPDPELYPGTAL